MSYRFFHLHQEDSVGCIKIDRPPVNAFNLEMMQELGAIFEGVGADKNIKGSADLGEHILIVVKG